jgi:hypothetical protein
MDYPIKTLDQLPLVLKGLRKQRGLTQAAMAESWASPSKATPGSRPIRRQPRWKGCSRCCACWMSKFRWIRPRRRAQDPNQADPASRETGARRRQGAQKGHLVSMGRRSHTQRLNIWMNGIPVGYWESTRQGERLRLLRRLAGGRAGPPHLAFAALPARQRALPGTARHRLFRQPPARQRRHPPPPGPAPPGRRHRCLQPAGQTGPGLRRRDPTAARRRSAIRRP